VPAGDEAARVSAGPDGLFNVALAAGDHRVVPLSPPGLPLPFAQPVDARVVADAWTRLDIGYDSGIREPLLRP
jgi:hypothetical protein